MLRFAQHDIKEDSIRVPVVAGNWKMNTTIPEAVALVDAMLNELPFIAGVDKVLCPPFVSLDAVRNRVAGTDILVGAQDAYWEPKGAFTGITKAPCCFDPSRLRGDLVLLRPKAGKPV